MLELIEQYKDWLFVVAIFIVGVIVIKITKVSLHKFFTKVHFDPTLEIFLQRTIGIFLWIILIILVLGNLGFDVSGFIAGLGVMGFIIGFATKDVLSNLAAGIFLLIHRPFKIGESVDVAGVKGTVKEMTISACIIITVDKQFVTIPNAKIWGGPIKNLSRLKKK